MCEVVAYRRLKTIGTFNQPIQWSRLLTTRTARPILKWGGGLTRSGYDGGGRQPHAEFLSFSD